MLSRNLSIALRRLRVAPARVKNAKLSHRNLEIINSRPH